MEFKSEQPRVHRDEHSRAGEQFTESVSLMERLRAPEGCPWDREQTLQTIRKYTLEEVYEVIDAIDRGHWADLREELGDLQLQILFYAQIAAGEGQFTMADVLETLNRKLVRRHPHVFGDEAAAEAGNNAALDPAPAGTSSEVLRNWDLIKRAEKAHSSDSLLDTVPRVFPALLEAAKLGAKSAKVGFDWPDIQGVVAKVYEEMRELEVEMKADVEDRARVEEELGDLLFTLANLARHMRIDPEIALRHANAKFRRRFAAMERHAGAALETMGATQLESLWSDAKTAERE